MVFMKKKIMQNTKDTLPNNFVPDLWITPTLWESICFIPYHMGEAWRSFKCKLWALKTYLPIVLKMNYGTDSGTIIEMMIFQLRLISNNMEKAVTAERFTISDPKTIAEIDKWIHLAKRQQNELIFSEEQGYLQYNLMSDKEQKQMWKKAAKVQKEEWNEMFDILKQHMQEWWL